MTTLEIVAMLAEQREKAEADRKAAIDERNELIGKLYVMDDATVGKAFKAYAAYMKDDALVDVHDEDVAVAHDLLSDIVMLDFWECN